MRLSCRWAPLLTLGPGRGGGVPGRRMHQALCRGSQKRVPASRADVHALPGERRAALLLVSDSPPFEEPAALEPVDDRDHEWF
jgi:hypothetical protein